MICKLDNFKLKSSLAAPLGGEDCASLIPFISDHLAVAPAAIESYDILGKSIDSRRGEPSFIYTLALHVAPGFESAFSALQPMDEEELQQFFSGELELPKAEAGNLEVIVVGSGPAGIFAATVLSMQGAKVLLLDAGSEVNKRVQAMEKFAKERKLSTEDNLLIGEGGAGTFSDGKLYSRIRDRRSRFVLKRFVEAGAPQDILYLKRPHIGSDNLRKVAVRMREKFISSGGEVRFGARVRNLLLSDGKCKGVVLENGETIASDAVLLAHGLGGRELTLNLIEKHNIPHRLKGFQLGCRIEHEQALIDKRQYRCDGRPSYLPAAEYQLSATAPGGSVLGVSTFCMCPGGEVVMASAWPGQLVTNGMSNYARRGPFANSALVATLSPQSFPRARDAYNFLADIESRAFRAGGESYAFPAQSAQGFLSGRLEFPEKKSSVSTGLTAARIDMLMPDDITRALRRALKVFDQKMPGFVKYGILIAPESCVSSPVRFERNEEKSYSGIPGLFIAGEGAGCAGGIMSAAVDGVRMAEAVLSQY